MDVVAGLCSAWLTALRFMTVVGTDRRVRSVLATPRGALASGVLLLVALIYSSELSVPVALLCWIVAFLALRILCASWLIPLLAAFALASAQFGGDMTVGVRWLVMGIALSSGAGVLVICIRRFRSAILVHRQRRATMAGRPKQE